ncbi:MAG: LTA synthase family protein [Marinagarivorans sp.]|nr:LTA synthase family protein [Marinagarivorans sp.]
MINHLILALRAFKQHAIFIVAALLLWSVARVLMLCFYYSERVTAVDGVATVLVQGVRFDVMTAGILVILPILVTLLLAPIKAVWPLLQRLLSGYFIAAFALVLFIELSTPSFISQFDVRPNILFVEYLKYPKEVIAMLTKAYTLDLVVAAVVVPFLSFCVWYFLRRCYSPQAPSFLGFVMAGPFILVVVLLVIRSSTGHRPANPSVVAFSSDLMVNSLALNSFYSVLWAIYSAKKDNKGTFAYGSMSEAEIIQSVKQEMYIADEHFTDATLPTLHRQTPRIKRDRPLNLVIILQESLGAEFVGSLGGLPLTPNIDALANEGLWFERFYATGTRSVRGIEAVITGFVPTPAQSVVKLQKSQRNFFTIAELLKMQGYSTTFIYGGESHFDNMRSFFMGNGFSHIIEEKDYKNPIFKGSWGVSDEDLLNKADEYFSEQGDKPFFSLVFSSSNHTPFEYPDNTIEQYDAEKGTVNNAVKYADYAVGQFIAKAKKSNYWNNTLFVIVADHNSRVYGSDLVPIERFHIPCLIVGADTQAMRYTKVASQIDLVPTLLSQMGIESEHPAVGRDLLRDDLVAVPGRAMMQYNDTQAYLEDDKAVIFQRGQKPELYNYVLAGEANSHERKLMQRTEHDAVNDEIFINKALAFSLWGALAYDAQSYRLPTQVLPAP